MPRGWPYATADPPPGINEVAASARTPAPTPEVEYPLDLDIGEVADGYHLIARSISLTPCACPRHSRWPAGSRRVRPRHHGHVLFDFAFVPEVPEERLGELWPNMSYGADVEPDGWAQWAMDGEEYEGPVPEARSAWFDFFLPDYDWIAHPVSDHQRNRIARLTFDPKTGGAKIEK